MAKTGKDKKGAAANKNKFKAEDKVFAMDGGDLYEAKVCNFCKFSVLSKRRQTYAQEARRSMASGVHPYHT